LLARAALAGAPPGHPSVVPGLAHGLDERGLVGGGAVVGHADLDVRRLERQVHGRGDPGQPPEALLDARDAGRARHALDREVDGRDGQVAGRLGACGAGRAHSSDPLGVTA
jgi:hypothetical protein